jgi:hypothetical protein
MKKLLIGLGTALVLLACNAMYADISPVPGIGSSASPGVPGSADSVSGGSTLPSGPNTGPAEMNLNDTSATTSIDGTSMPKPNSY